MAAPPACHHEEYQLIGAGHVDCCLFVFYINSDRNIENVKTRFSLREKKKKKKTSDEAQTNRPEPGSYQSGNRRLYLAI